MSSSTTSTPTTTTATVTDDSATPAGTKADDKLRTALAAEPASTATELALAAGIGRSTVGKILARWAEDGTVVKVETGGSSGGRGRTADRWALADPADAGTATADPTDPTDPTTATADPTDPTDPTTATTDPTDPTTATTDPTDPTDPTTATTDPTDPTTATTDPTATATATTDPTDPTTATTDPTATATATTDPTDPTTATTDPTATATATADPTDAGTDGSVPPAERPKRLSPGSLRGMVEDHLRDHSDESFGPSEIAKVLGRSSGAIANALEKLVEEGTAKRTQDKPRRYALVPGK